MTLGRIEGRLLRLEAAQPHTDALPLQRIIADPERDAWARTDEGISGEIERRGLRGHVIVRRIVEPGAR